MANSRRYQQLLVQLNRLRKHFLPVRWNPTGVYSKRKIDYAIAYRIFAHAEIESFIEEILLRVVDENYSRWSAAGKPSFVLICLVAASKTGWQDAEAEELGMIPMKPPKEKRDDDSIHQWIERAVQQYRDIVENNHGVTSQNLKRLLMPVGIAMSDLDLTWLNNMNSFAGQRGFVAHHSRIGVTTLPDPKTEKDMVENLKLGLKDLDEKVIAIKN